MIYVCSDVHGHGDRFYKLLKEINLKDSDILYILGDLIDRNENSIELLKYVMSQKNIKLLMGNHEEFMFSYLFNLNKIGRLNEKNKFPNDIWFDENNGGLETLKDFVKESAEEKRNILKFLYHIPLVCILDIDGTKFHLSHTGTLPNILEKNIWKLSDVNIKQKQIITWGTPFREDIYLPPSYYSNECINIFGHVPVQKITGRNSFEMLRIDNLIDIDSGCAMFDLEKRSNLKTALSCLCLNTMEEYYIV